MKKQILLLAPMAFLALTGCQKGGGKENQSSDQDFSGKITINFWHTFGDKPETALEGKVAQFEKLVKENEGVDVDVVLSYQGAYKDMPKKVTTGIATGDNPTIAIAYADHVADYLDLEGNDAGKYVVNLDKFLKDESLTFGTDKYLGDTMGESDMIKSYMDEGRTLPREGTYLIPLMKSTEIMCYNLTAVKTAMQYVKPDLPVDRVKDYMKTITWDELIEIAAAAYEHKNEISTNLEYPIYYDSDSNLFITELYQNNIGYSSIDSEGKGHIDFEDEPNLTKAKAIVTKLLQARQAHLLTTKGAEGTYASNNFKEAKTIFSIGSTGGTGYTIPDAGQFDVGFAKVPTMGGEDGRVGYISQGPSVCFLNNRSLTTAENEATLKYAWKLVKYLTSKQVNVSLCVTGSEGYSPVRNSCYTTETYSDFIEDGEYYAEAALVTQNDINGQFYNSAVFTGSATLRTEVGALITNVLKDKSPMSVDDAFTLAINNAKKDIR